MSCLRGDLADGQEPKKKDPVIVAGKDVGEVDNNYFLVPVKILDHDGQLTTSFPIENRLVPQGTQRGTLDSRPLECHLFDCVQLQRDAAATHSEHKLACWCAIVASATAGPCHSIRIFLQECLPELITQ